MVQRKADDLMSDEQFWSRLREVILLIVGLYIFNTTFGLIIFSKLGQQRNAVSIGLLSIMWPVFGGLFYLMTITITKTDE